VDLTFYGLGIKREDLGQLNVAVEPEQGGKVIEPVVEVSDRARSQPSILTFGGKTESGRLVLERNFQPFWRTAAEVGQ
jgi:hypothetical protein